MAIRLIDTHCHLNHDQFTAEPGGVSDALDRAGEAGIDRVIVVGFDMPSSEEAVSLADRDPRVFAAVAVHPHDSRHYDAESEGRLRELAANPRAAAIGEIGLDFHYEFSPRDAQYAAFRAQLRVAREAGLPVIIHCREAYPELLDVLETEAGGLCGVLHCFAGSLAEAQRALRIGWYLGIGGVVTFKNAEALREAAREAPLDRLLLETDAPYLAPAPHRGKRNEPAYTRLIAERVAEIRGVRLEELAEATTSNALRLFPRLAG